MNKIKNRAFLGTLLLMSFTALNLIAEPAFASSPPTQGVKLTPIGHPIWKPVDVHLFSASIGFGPDYAEFSVTQGQLLPPPNHEPHPQLGIGPGTQHLPPYDAEFAHGIVQQGFCDSMHFNTSSFTNSQGVWLVWMNVPAPGATGSSPDFVSGSIIPNSLFPIHVSGIDLHNGKVFSTLADFEVPALDESLDPPFNVEGHSHFPIFMADSADFGPPGAKLPGNYAYKISMTDTSGSGWQIEAHFELSRTSISKQNRCRYTDSE
ncbi:MAG: hypothetical protein HOP02_14475 [Methylococcaceae bacterium]|nr:hypothetical protein [Methylococcaceae bacterium]